MRINSRKRSPFGEVCIGVRPLREIHVLNSLTEIDLSNTISKLDAAATDIVAHQRDSLAQRKDLAQKTKDFRKLDDEGKLGEYKSLLKGKARDLPANMPLMRAC
jgi:hypothetical protein